MVYLHVQFIPEQPAGLITNFMKFILYHRKGNVLENESFTSPSAEESEASLPITFKEHVKYRHRHMQLIKAYYSDLRETSIYPHRCPFFLR